MFLTALLALNFHSPVATTAPAHACHGFFPKNNYQIHSMVATGISRSAFNGVISTMEKTWGETARQHGAELVFNNLWSDATVNSDTDVEDNKWVINAYGGLARFPGMTVDAYTLVACHELGHHLGGAPLYTGEDWASVEGEADYFATLKCLKTMWGPKAVKRVQAASLVLGKVLAKLDESKVPQLNTPDKSVVTETFEDHPAAQCRVDTYVKGYECNADGEFSMSNPQPGSCYDYNTMVGVRPLCWFKP